MTEHRCRPNHPQRSVSYEFGIRYAHRTARQLYRRADRAIHAPSPQVKIKTTHQPEPNSVITLKQKTLIGGLQV